MIDIIVLDRDEVSIGLKAHFFEVFGEGVRPKQVEVVLVVEFLRIPRKRKQVDVDCQLVDHAFEVHHEQVEIFYHLVGKCHDRFDILLEFPAALEVLFQLGLFLRQLLDGLDVVDETKNSQNRVQNQKNPTDGNSCWICGAHYLNHKKHSTDYV